MMRRIDQFGPHGFRAILWHQGESDSHQKPEHEISGAIYRSILERVILSTRKQAGWDIPWFVAQASYGTPEIPSWQPVREAQQSLWQSGIALQDPTPTPSPRHTAKTTPRGPLQRCGSQGSRSVMGASGRALSGHAAAAAKRSSHISVVDILECLRTLRLRVAQR